MKREFLYFAIFGIVNTVTALTIYWILLLFFGHQLSYAITFTIGTIMSWWFNSTKTFSGNLSLKKLIPYFGFYIFSYYLGRVILEICVSDLNIKANLAIFIVILIGLPVNFLGSRLVIKWKR